MVKEIEISLRPEDLNNEDLIREKLIRKLNVQSSRVRDIVPLRRSLDARQKYPVYRIKWAVYLDQNKEEEKAIISNFKKVSKDRDVVIVGAGPAGYFAALELLEAGIKPIIIERGKDVRTRRKDLKAIQQEGIVNPDSNYCFGEGGAGTYSDGKLYTRSHKRGKIEKVLQLLVEHGARTDILIDAHPHIGSNKLPGIVAEIRNTIEKYGGEIHFEKRVVDFIISKGVMNGVVCEKGEVFHCKNMILATGHSARDIFYLLDTNGIRLESKDFALGVRIEHPQGLIDNIQYNQNPRSAFLPASSYGLSCQINGHGVFSFCMCPGGLIVPSATSPGEIVLNGMSLSRRDSKYANAGTVVSINQKDLKSNDGKWASLKFQQSIEQSIFQLGDGSQKAPAQKLIDFVDGKLSVDLNNCSYIPGIYSAPLHQVLPEFIYNKLRLGIIEFGKKMNGYYTNLANVLAIESRTSSPIRIPRDPISKMSEDCIGLYPCGEGAGYAGGILSAAMDGQNVAKAIVNKLS